MVVPKLVVSKQVYEKIEKLLLTADAPAMKR